MATEIAKAYVQIIPTARGIKASLENDLGSAGEAAGESAGAKSGSSFVGSMGAAIAKGAAVLTAAAATAVGALVKSAVSSYADYEQLAGGIETLFDNSEAMEELRAELKASGATAAEAAEAVLSMENPIETVMQNAAKAYKTAGLSANDYMETAIGFSAALINSLEGDTKRAAALTDLAITDMADNANKMGTSLESLQNAYTGFSRGNFTMLDNLALGFSGTKAGMQELLDKAKELAGVEFDIESYADIVEAIHVVQTEMGITGTTAAEAAGTISGSTASMKASWANLVRGIADDNADLSTLIDEFVATIAGNENGEGGVIGNLLPRIEAALGGVGSLIERLAPTIADSLPTLVTTLLPSLISSAGTLLTGTVNAVLENTDLIIQLATDLITTLVTTLTENAGLLVDSALTLLDALLNGLLENLDTIISGALELVLALVTGLKEHAQELLAAAVEIVVTLVDLLTNEENIGNIIECALELVVELAYGLMDAIPQLVEAAFELINGIVSYMLDPENIMKLVGMALEIVIAIVGGLISAIPELLVGVVKLITSLINGFKETDWAGVGKNVIDGIWSGLKTAWENVKKWFTDAWNNLIGNVKSLLGIASPSKVFRDQIGKQIAAGIGVGFSDEIGAVQREITGEMNGILGNLSGAVVSMNANVNAAAPSGFDTSAIDRLVSAVGNTAAHIHIYLDSKEIKAGQQRLARAVG